MTPGFQHSHRFCMSGSNLLPIVVLIPFCFPSVRCTLKRSVLTKLHGPLHSMIAPPYSCMGSSGNPWGTIDPAYDPLGVYFMHCQISLVFIRRKHLFLGMFVFSWSTVYLVPIYCGFLEGH